MKQYHLLPLSLALLAQGFSEDFSTESIPLYFLSSSELQEEEEFFDSSSMTLDKTLLDFSLAPEAQCEELASVSTQKASSQVAQKPRNDYDDEDDEDEDEEEDEDEGEDTALAPAQKEESLQPQVVLADPLKQAQGPEGSLRQRRQERAAHIQRQRAQRLTKIKESTLPQSDDLSKEATPQATHPTAQSATSETQKAPMAAPSKKRIQRTRQTARSKPPVAAPEGTAVPAQKAAPSKKRIQRTRQTARSTPSEPQVAAPENIAVPAQEVAQSTTPDTQKTPSKPAEASEPTKRSPRAFKRQRPTTAAVQNETPPDENTEDPNLQKPSAPPETPPPQSPKGPPSEKSYGRQRPTSQARPSIRKRSPLAQTSKRPRTLAAAKKEKLAEKEKPLDTSPRMTVPEAVNLSARPIVKNNGLWIDGEAIFWQAYEENLEFAYKGNTSPEDWSIKSPDFEWNWGWRVGLGYNLPLDQWDLALEWLHVNNFARGKAHANPSSEDNPLLYNVWTSTSASLTGGTEAKSHWENFLNQVDFNMGRQFYVGRFLNIRPHMGMRSAWIFQKYKTDFEGLLLGTPTNVDVRMTNRYWGLGFCAGLGSDWMLGKGFSIYGDAGLALLIGFFNIHQHGRGNDIDSFKISKGFRAGRPIFDLDLGLKWSSKFYRNNCAFSVKAGYEYHLYSDMNQFLQSNGSSDLELFNPAMGDLSYQGITLAGRFDF